jgi:hypothetical protein
VRWVASRAASDIVVAENATNTMSSREEAMGMEAATAGRCSRDRHKRAVPQHEDNQVHHEESVQQFANGRHDGMMGRDWQRVESSKATDKGKETWEIHSLQR